MKFLVTGGSGFIGSRLCQELINAGHEVTILTRNTEKTAAKFKGTLTIIHSLDNVTAYYDVIINLAGESLSDGRWTAQKKKLLFTSRLETTQAVIDYIARVEQKPQLLISGSAIGYYGSNLDHAFTELDNPLEKDFAHDLCKQWEDKAYQAKQYDVRVCCLRTGIVLGKKGGALAKMYLPFYLGLGGKMGDGTQWMSWIHMEDLLGLIAHMINHPTLEGPVNGTAPMPVTNEVFTKTLGKALHRPAIFTIPAFALKLLLGEMAEMLLLKGQKVIPQKAIESGYDFQYKTIDTALENIIKP